MVGGWNDGGSLVARQGYSQGNLVDKRVYGCDIPNYFPNNAYTWVSTDVNETLYCDDNGWWYGRHITPTQCAPAIETCAVRPPSEDPATGQLSYDIACYVNVTAGDTNNAFYSQRDPETGL
jgi:hypothetical protein